MPAKTTTTRIGTKHAANTARMFKRFAPMPGGLTATDLSNEFIAWPARRATLHERNGIGRFGAQAVEVLGDILMPALATSPHLPYRAKTYGERMLRRIIDRPRDSRRNRD
jgi:hypothetical protein